MGVFQPDTASGQPTTHGQPAFQMVRRGYDPAQVDAHITELVAA
ncbi:MAG TPA: DivIVA domain-containing protein [Actinomycetes bacterium]|jgi:DivIVA domain-containing protein